MSIPQEWLGTYAMNHDGWSGTLRIRDSKADCTSTPWCAFILTYIDSEGKIFNGKINNMSQDNDHMTFYINFSGNIQRFEGYLFSQDKNKIAGITYWENRTYGFYGIRKS